MNIWELLNFSGPLFRTLPFSGLFHWIITKITTFSRKIANSAVLTTEIGRQRRYVKNDQKMAQKSQKYQKKWFWLLLFSPKCPKTCFGQNFPLFLRYEHIKTGFLGFLRLFRHFMVVFTPNLRGKDCWICDFLTECGYFSDNSMK